MFQSPQQFPKSILPPRFPLGVKWNLHIRRSFGLGEAICSHEVVCFDLWRNTEICLGTPLGWLDTSAFTQKNRFNGGLSTGRMWGTVGPEWSSSEDTSVSVAIPVEEGISLESSEMGELNHPFFWDPVGAVRGAES